MNREQRRRYARAIKKENPELAKLLLAKRNATNFKIGDKVKINADRILKEDKDAKDEEFIDFIQRAQKRHVEILDLGALATLLTFKDKKSNRQFIIHSKYVSEHKPLEDKAK